MGDIDIGGLLGLVIVGGVANKMLSNGQQQNQQSSSAKKKIGKKEESNAYTKERAVFGSGKYSPF